MSSPFDAYRETVTRLRGTPIIDDFENVVGIDWTNPDTLDIDGWLFQPGGSSLGTDVNGQPIVSKPTITRPGFDAVDILAIDRIERQGRIWQVDGDPEQFPRHCVVNLKAVS